MIRHLSKLPFTPKNVLDIGANIGGFTKECRKFWPLADYYLIEGNEICEPALRYMNEHYYIELLGDMDGREVTFYKTTVSQICTGNSIYRELTPAYDDDKLIKETRKLITLDTLFKNNDIVFDFAKLDTQGSELDIMRGGVKTLLSCKYILLEVSLKQYNANIPLKDEVVDYMMGIGYKKHEIIEQHIWLSESLPHIRHGDVFQEDIIFER